MTTRIRFSDVGPRKATFEADIPTYGDALDEPAMYRAVRKSKALGSRGIEFGSDGLTLVGGFRVVGKWAVADVAISEAL